MRLSSYIKYSFYPKKQAKNFILSITIINLLFFLITIFKCSLHNEIILSSNKYDKDTIYQDLSYAQGTDYLNISNSNYKLLTQKGYEIDISYLICAEAKINNKYNTYERVYYSNTYDHIYKYGINAKVIYSSEIESKYSALITKEKSLELFNCENSIGKNINFNNNTYVIDKVIEPDNTYYGIYSRNYNYYRDDYIYFKDNDFNASNLDIKSIKIAYKIKDLDNAKLSYVKSIINNTYSNLDIYNDNMLGFSYIFNIVRIISIFTLVFFVFNTLILLVSKMKSSKYDIRTRTIFFSLKSNLIKGYSLSFITLFGISIIISFMISLIVYLILTIKFSSFNWLNINILIYLLIEILTSFILSFVITKYSKKI